MRSDDKDMERISCDYKPRPGPALLALVIFAAFMVAAANIALTNSSGMRLFRLVHIGVKGTSAVMWLVAALMAVAAFLSLLALLNSFSRSRRLEFAEDRLTLPASRLSSAEQTIPLRSVISLKVVPNQKHKILKVRHSGGTADVHSGLMPSMDMFDQLCEDIARRHAELRAARAAAHAQGR